MSDYSNISNYTLKGDIGEGNFGKVKLGIFKQTGEEFAVKILNKKMIKEKMKNTVFKENDIIKRFNHVNVIFVLDIIEDPENYYIVMEYCKKGELFDYIVDQQRLEEDEAAYFFYQLINGVEYIHSLDVAHRDLKPENLLLNENKILKIIDFGLSHEFNGEELLKTKCGSPSYAAPEIIKGLPYDGFKTDVWCCGIILYAMVCGYLPFEGENNKILFKNIVECNPDIPEYLGEDTQDLISAILKPEPNDRVTIEQIKEHEFYLRGKNLCDIRIEDDVDKINQQLMKKNSKNNQNLNFIRQNTTPIPQPAYITPVIPYQNNGNNIEPNNNLITISIPIINKDKSKYISVCYYLSQIIIKNKNINNCFTISENSLENITIINPYNIYNNYAKYYNISSIYIIFYKNGNNIDNKLELKQAIIEQQGKNNEDENKNNIDDNNLSNKVGRVVLIIVIVVIVLTVFFFVFIYIRKLNIKKKEMNYQAAINSENELLAKGIYNTLF